MNSRVWPPGAFWDWSLRTYAEPGVAEACLALQNRHGLDVNLLLFVVWAGAEGHTLSETAVGDAIDRVRRWHAEIVRPLRSLRRRLKNDPHGADPALAAALRTQISAAELDAEHVEQLVLNDLMKGREAIPSGTAMHTNLARFASAISLVWNDEDQRDLDTLIAAASRPETAVKGTIGLSRG